MKNFFLISIWIEKRVQEPKIIEDIDILSPFGTQIHLTCPNRYANIYYTLDGSLPTRHFDNVHVNNKKKKKRKTVFYYLNLGIWSRHRRTFNWTRFTSYTCLFNWRSEIAEYCRNEQVCFHISKVYDVEIRHVLWLSASFRNMIQWF